MTGTVVVSAGSVVSVEEVAFLAAEVTMSAGAVVNSRAQGLRQHRFAERVCRHCHTIRLECAIGPHATSVAARTFAVGACSGRTSDRRGGIGADIVWAWGFVWVSGRLGQEGQDSLQERLLSGTDECPKKGHLGITIQCHQSRAETAERCLCTMYLESKEFVPPCGMRGHAKQAHVVAGQHGV